MNEERRTKHEERVLILAGGGHTHVGVLRAFAAKREPGLRVSVVSPHAASLYTGMVPGVIARRYALAEAQIDLRELASRAGAELIVSRLVGIDPRRRRVEIENGGALTYDLLSLDIGARPALEDRIADQGVARVKPIEAAVTDIEAALAEPVPADGLRAVVVGAGAGGCEIAFALAARLRAEGGGSVVICDPAERPVESRHPRTSAAVLRAFAAKGIEFVGDAHVVHATSSGVRFADGRVLAASLVVWATGAAGPGLFRGAGLPLDERGFLCVGDDLRCAEFPEIFAAGDCAALASYPNLPKAGVFAVRQAPVLAANLRAAARGKRTRAFRPQTETLALLNTCDGRAIFSRGGVAFRGRLAWWLKDWIDRRYVHRRPG